ncbi:hypothetical protein CHUAL_013904 [Chamberlinius hualienensis]
MSLTSASTINITENNLIDKPLVVFKKKEGSFQCYVCFWSTNDEPCGDKAFDVAPGAAGKFMINCFTCYKKVLHEANGVKVKILRGCAQNRPFYALDCQKILYQDGSYLETCACAKPYCNYVSRVVHKVGEQLITVLKMTTRIVLLLLITFFSVGHCTMCYLCSWSPENTRNNTCYGDNWKPEATDHIDCHNGCESVTQFDKNGVISQFYRNCANKIVSRSPICQKELHKAGNRRVCSCNMHLCNMATPVKSISPMLITLLTLLTLNLVFL